MEHALQDRLLWRELGSTSRYSSFRGIYGDRVWVDDLDIVNELGGHSGCVNALSWSTSGRLLASGSDDQHLNIHSYQSNSSTSPFSLTTTVATGHTANIFSVKFMPHSNDRTLVTAAGDAEVRVFDIEYSGRSAESSTDANMASTARGQRFQNMYKGVRYLTDGNTNARVYRSHADRVKRIVTESSPNLFLTCSEDGEVRQFDLRLPSSAYPPPRGGRGFLAHRADHDNSNVPPPLISYKKFNLDLNTISCSPNQPHYIALGGSHLHCFLHDRRMVGRDFAEECGDPGRPSSAASMSSGENEFMGQATRCVRKFAPNGRKKMRKIDNGHITACKISDANPNEMIASWSGDHIYSFDLIRSPDANEEGIRGASATTSVSDKSRAKESRDRKRKKHASNGSLESERKSSKSSSARYANDGDGDRALRVRYENGQSEDIAMGDVAPNVPLSMLEAARESVMSESQKRSLQIAESCVKIRKLIFSLEASARSAKGSLDPAAHRASFTSALGLAASCLPEMDEISNSWGYPMDPVEEDVIFQQTLRTNRNSSRRFVQAAGTLARILGGKLQTTSHIPSPALDLFKEMRPAPRRGLPRSSAETFRLDFLKAILCWLEGGTGALCPDDAPESAVHDNLIPYLLRSAGETAIPNIDASRFERDETRHLFASESAAVIAFGNAVRMPLEELSRAIMPASSSAGESSIPVAQDRKAALKFWGFKVGRGLLMNASEGVNFQFVDTAFGGLGTAKVEEDTAHEDIDPEEEEAMVETVSLVTGPTRIPTQGISSSSRRGVSEHEVESGASDETAQTPQSSMQSSGRDVEMEDTESDADVILMDDLHDEIRDHMEAGYDEMDDSDDDDNADEDSEADDEDGDITAEERSFMFRSASDRGKLREMVERDVPCHSHTRTYKGHCNVKTVKDCNFFGLQDEYVVSGSDDGNLFIWDKRTSQLVNILNGDNQVVNVIQGHPYEPVLAVSGIDHTIKIFSPDYRDQTDARAGVNISSSVNGSTGYSSISGRRRRNLDDDARTEEGLPSRKRMQQSYQIMGQNDVERNRGIQDTFITRGMLAQLAAGLRARQAGANHGGNVGGVELSEDGESIVVDDNCLVM